jgi:type III secretion protein R
MNSGLFTGDSLSAAFGLVALALVPLALVTLTSFAKMSVVFSALRNALGAPDVPSSVIVSALALALSAYVMAPLATRIEARVAAAPGKRDLTALIEAAREPVTSFLSRNAGEAEKRLFVSLARERGADATEQDLSLLWASFAVSELKRGFQLASFLFVPFLVLDLVVAHVLLALGMHGLTPQSVSLPFKLLLFASVDGFALLSRALVLGYT